MFSEEVKKKLMRNWGEKADALACRAEVKLYDDATKFIGYVYAMNPDDENNIKIVAKGAYFDTFDTNLSLLQAFSCNGEGLQIDEEYRPQHVAELIRKLNEGKMI